MLAKANRKPTPEAPAAADSQASITAAIKRQKVQASKVSPEEKEVSTHVYDLCMALKKLAELS